LWVRIGVSVRVRVRVKVRARGGSARSGREKLRRVRIETF
jgi:hypothetical protein